MLIFAFADDGMYEEDEDADADLQQGVYSSLHNNTVLSSEDSSQHSSPVRIPSSQSSGLIVAHSTPPHNPGNNRSPHPHHPITSGSTASTPDSPRHAPPPRSATPTSIPLPPSGHKVLPSPVGKAGQTVGSLTRSSSMTVRSPSSQTRKPAQRPTAMSSGSGNGSSGPLQAVHRGVISPSASSGRKAHLLGRSNSTASSSPSTTMACQFVRPSAVTNSHPNTPNSSLPRNMTRSSSMSSTSTTWSNTYCMKESCV